MNGNMMQGFLNKIQKSKKELHNKFLIKYIYIFIVIIFENKMYNIYIKIDAYKNEQFDT